MRSYSLNGCGRDLSLSVRVNKGVPKRMPKQPFIALRNTLSFLQRVYNRLYGTPTKWRIISHVANLFDKVLTFIGITLYHLHETNPIGKVFLGEGTSLFGIVAFFIFGIMCIEYINRVRPKWLMAESALLIVVVGSNLILILRGA